MEPKVIHTDNSLELANHVKTYLGIIVRQHRTDRKPMGLLREQCAEYKKEGNRSECGFHCCNEVLVKRPNRGGRLLLRFIIPQESPGSVTPICETSQIPEWLLSDGTQTQEFFSWVLYMRDVFILTFGKPKISRKDLVKSYHSKKFFGSLVEYYPIAGNWKSCEPGPKVKNPSIWKESLTWIAECSSDMVGGI